MNILKRILRKLIRVAKKIYFFIFYHLGDILCGNKDTLMITWDTEMNNFGDIITPLIIRYFSKKKIKRIKRPSFYNKEHYFVIGSILHRATKTTIIWGSGFISSESHCQEKPKTILAVRGPLTRQILLNDGIDCPKVYGDPALLLPRIYTPIFKKKYKIGIIPHYVDKENTWLLQFKNNPDINIIDVQQNNPFRFIDEILKCEKILSSSLHGIIVSDAYDIPSIWVEFSNKVSGEGFKFRDYFKSVNRIDKNPFKIKINTKLSELVEQFYSYKINIDLNKLIEVCPFK